MFLDTSRHAHVHNKGCVCVCVCVCRCCWTGIAHRKILRYHYRKILLYRKNLRCRRNLRYRCLKILRCRTILLHRKIQLLNPTGYNGFVLSAGGTTKMTTRNDVINEFEFNNLTLRLWLPYDCIMHVQKQTSIQLIRYVN